MQVKLTGNEIYGCDGEFHIYELQVLAESIEYRATISGGKEQHRSAARISKIREKLSDIITSGL